MGLFRPFLGLGPAFWGRVLAGAGQIKEIRPLLINFLTASASHPFLGMMRQLTATLFKVAFLAILGQNGRFSRAQAAVFSGFGWVAPPFGVRFLTRAVF